ncbi:hypothetical protein MRB53_040841 [Persea americana]|nr:hypothetical protein MRB53_040841 [Persea americana]
MMASEAAIDEVPPAAKLKKSKIRSTNAAAEDTEVPQSAIELEKPRKPRKPLASAVRDDTKVVEPKKRKLRVKQEEIANQQDSSSEEESIKPEAKDESDEESVAWDDVDINVKTGASAKFDTEGDQQEGLNLTLEKAERIQLAKTGKKKQSVRAVHERLFCHYMSSIALVAHTAWRNTWISETSLQRAVRGWFKKKSVCFMKSSSVQRELRSRTIQPPLRISQN